MIEMALALYGAPMVALLQLPDWLGNLLVGVIITAKMGLAGWALARAGRSPLWVLLLLVPFVDVAALWAFAYGPWPAMPEPAADEPAADEPAADQPGANASLQNWPGSP